MAVIPSCWRYQIGDTKYERLPLCRYRSSYLMPTVFPDKLGRRRLKRLLHAYEEKAFEGTIPWDCAEAIAAHEQIDREYERAWQMMLAHLDEQALTIIDLQERLRSVEDKGPC